MKPFFFLLIMLVFQNHLLAQSRLGSSAADIRSEFWETKYQLTPSYSDNGTYNIRIFTDDATVFYYFDADMICKVTMIIPDNQGILNGYVEHYNKSYVIVSDTKWRMYSNSGISDIELVFMEGGGYFFAWSIGQR